MTGDILGQIDDAVQANLCGCGCGQQVPDRGPSPDFVNEKHQYAWQAERRAANKPAGDWYMRLREIDVAHDPDCDPAGCTHHTYQARIATVTIDVREDDGTDTDEDCDDLNCPCHTPFRECAPNAYLVTAPSKLSQLRRAINRIRGIDR